MSTALTIIKSNVITTTLCFEECKRKTNKTSRHSDVIVTEGPVWIIRWEVWRGNYPLSSSKCTPTACKNKLTKHIFKRLLFYQNTTIKSVNDD